MSCVSFRRRLRLLFPSLTRGVASFRKLSAEADLCRLRPVCLGERFNCLRRSAADATRLLVSRAAGLRLLSPATLPALDKRSLLLGGFGGIVETRRLPPRRLPELLLLIFRSVTELFRVPVIMERRFPRAPICLGLPPSAPRFVAAALAAFVSSKRSSSQDTDRRQPGLFLRFVVVRLEMARPLFALAMSNCQPGSAFMRFRLDSNLPRRAIWSLNMDNRSCEALAFILPLLLGAAIVGFGESDNFSISYSGSF
mmetsp:Transcript_65509/g.133256  ORF Transcript_65509/g.133256 Transcript_65509/m.133256 type:complete len:254 (-) Transcript_65509:230-991(-)